MKREEEEQEFLQFMLKQNKYDVDRKKDNKNKMKSFFDDDNDDSYDEAVSSRGISEDNSVSGDVNSSIKEQSDDSNQELAFASKSLKKAKKNKKMIDKKEEEEKPE